MEQEEKFHSAEGYAASIEKGGYKLVVLIERNVMSSEGIPTTRLGGADKRWDYRLMLMNVAGFFGPDIDLDSLRVSLDEAGENGWELVSVVPITRGQGQTANLLAILKRPR